ncbi:POC1 centriolar protein A [Ceratobasidium sp. 392]|nr:POC1 centriolar protein A [Ceratobasidium sp. 392]
MSTMIDVGNILNMVIANANTLSRIAENSLGRSSMHATLERLRRVQGASWDEFRVCLSNTRVNLINEIFVWVPDPGRLGKINEDVVTQGAKIFLLTAVAGAGKTTVAHTVAQRFVELGQLAFSFFFDRETEGRNSATALFSSMAADMSQLDDHLAERIILAIEADRTLPNAPLSRQFENLVLKPCQNYNTPKPVVFVIDGLDEAWDDTVLDILRDHAFRLPSAFRIFLTSRMRPELDSLRRQPHVHWVDFDIGTQTNMDDIALFIPDRLQQLARQRPDLGETWPTEQMQSRFISKADGLF